MDEFNKIRKEFHIRGKSIFKIAQEYNRSWATVKNIITIPDHKIVLRGKRPERFKIVITPEIEKKIHEILDFEKINKVPRKQRYTAKAIYKKLKEENNYNGSAKRIRTVVAQIRRERKQTDQNSYLNLDFEFGSYLQVDHGPAEVEISGVRLEGNLFVASVPGKCLRYCQFYPLKAQEAWGYFHELTYNFFGGTFPKIIYDNDSVLRINSTGEKTSFCIDMENHYQFDAIFCNKASGWEKGSVECAVGFCRRNFLPGIQSFDTIEKLNKYLEEECLKHIINQKNYLSNEPLIDLFDELKQKLQPYNKGRIWGRWIDCKVNSFQQVSYQDRHYSVPERYVGSTVKLFVSVTNINIYDGDTLICSHERLYLTKQDSLILDHYLDQLLRKPRAINYAKVIKNQIFEDELVAFRKQLEFRYTEKDAGKQFIETLILQRMSSKEDFITAIRLSLKYNSISYHGVKSILSQLQIDQVRTPVNVNFPNIEKNFSLNKYAELENTEML